MPSLCLPQDAGRSPGITWSFFVRRVHHRLDRRPASAAQLADAVAAIKASRKPLIICGGGVKYAGAGKVVPFAERYGIPFAETQAGKGTVVSSIR